jgi:hypothetical protein
VRRLPDIPHKNPLQAAWVRAVYNTYDTLTGAGMMTQQIQDDALVRLERRLAAATPVGLQQAIFGELYTEYTR